MLFGVLLCPPFDRYGCNTGGINYVGVGEIFLQCCSEAGTRPHGCKGSLEMLNSVGKPDLVIWCFLILNELIVYLRADGYCSSWTSGGPQFRNHWSRQILSTVLDRGFPRFQSFLALSFLLLEIQGLNLGKAWGLLFNYGPSFRLCAYISKISFY